eukprot:TRINITY_DN3408_c0_g1_i1.p1 TRINITY_DN3408_c0_g1~~TRINITY_DN3408_c0_g1_i1.p1  ORF type:complete len:300 (-),score=64.89 TRINITY_DN3408_c0_g1_i1:432-1331(-)
MNSISNSYRIVLARPDGLSRSQLFVDFSPSYDRKPHPDIQLEQAIEEVWKQRISTNPSLYNGKKFRYGGCRSLLCDGKSLQMPPNCLCLGLTDYRTFIGTNLAPSWENFLVPVEDDAEQCAHVSSPLGNGAVVETKDNYIVVLERSHNVGEFPGHLVFPGGHSEPKELGISSHAYGGEETDVESLNSRISEEMFDGILREVVEEIGVPEIALSDPIFIGVSRRALNVRPTAFFFIKCSLDSAEVYDFYAKAEDGFESTNLHMVPKSELACAALKMPGCHRGGFALYELMVKKQEAPETL